MTKCFSPRKHEGKIRDVVFLPLDTRMNLLHFESQLPPLGAAILEASIHQSSYASTKLPPDVSTDPLPFTIDFITTPYAQGGPDKMDLQAFTITIEYRLRRGSYSSPASVAPRLDSRLRSRRSRDRIPALLPTLR